MDYKKIYWVDVPDPDNMPPISDYPDVPEYQTDIQALDAENLNRIEGGIEEAHTEIENLDMALENHTHTPGQIGAAPSDHTHTPASIGAASNSHNHDASDINSGTFPVTRGGTGKVSVTSGSYLVGNGSNTMTEKTPAQVREHIGASQIGHKHASNDITDIIPATKGGTGGTTAKQARDNLGITPTFVETTLLASGWNNGEYSFESIYSSNSYNLEVSLKGDDLTTTQKLAFDNAEIVGCNKSNKIKAFGVIPTINIPIVLKVVNK